MKTLRRNRIIIALVLLLSLLPMGIVKATHVHDSDAISTVETSAHATRTMAQPTTTVRFANSSYRLLSKRQSLILISQPSSCRSFLRSLAQESWKQRLSAHFSVRLLLHIKLNFKFFFISYPNK